MQYDPFSKNLKCKVFDIETTGLYAAHDMIISASFIDPDGSGLVQYFTESPSSEDFTISQILNEIADCDCLITFNGNSFDIPFVLTRARKYGLADKLPLTRNLDVYRLLKSYWQLAPRMESLRQKAVEQALGIDWQRTDMIGGGECISLYNSYIRTGAAEPKELILLHNADDVRQLAAICGKLSFLPYDRIAFETGIYLKLISQDLISSTEYRVLTGPMKIAADKLSLNARIAPACMPTAYYEDSFHLQSDADGKVSLDVFAKRKGPLLFCDLRKLPVDKSLFEKLKGFEADYLLLAENDDINYNACALLCAELLKTLG